MNVPFVSSGALSRRHYKLVSDVENAATMQAADQFLLAEINHIQRRARSADLSLKDWKENLILLLHCSLTISAALPMHALDFALPHAVTVAEAGESVPDKRIGYLFCAEVMSHDHELRLMLVNTIRKDLESQEIPRICLALDALITSPSHDVISAVQPRLHDLLSHTSLHVRRRALLAFRALAEHDAALLHRISGDITKRLHDTYPVVLNAALAVAIAAVEHGAVKAHVFRRTVHELLSSLMQARESNLAHGPLLQTLRALRTIGLNEESLLRVSSVLTSAVKSGDKALALSVFMLFSTVKPMTLLDEGLSPVADIRDYLTSRDVNEQVLFLNCLDSIDPILWAGTKPDVRPLVLEEWEVERVMGFLDSPDPLIRKKTLAILNKIDGNIVSTYYVQSVETMPSDLPLPAREAYVGRLLEVIETQCYEEGEAYANAVLDLLRKLSMLSTVASTSSSSPVPSGSVDLSATVKPAAGRPHVLESVVTAVLEHIRFGKANFRVGCATTFVASVLSTESESSLMVETFEAHGQTGESSVEPTAMVITAALATEFCGQLAMAPVSLLRGFSTRLDRCPVGVQDACLLAMLRIAVECEDVPGDVLHTVQELARNAGRHIRRRCEQFTTLSQQPTVLREVIQRARSHSLPDFLEALQVTRLPNASAASKPGSSPVLSERSLSGSKLRYDAYEAPHPAARIRARRLSSGTSSVHSGMSAEKDLSRTVSPGQLTLMASLTDADNALNPPQARSHAPRPQVQTAVDDLASRVDLIAFDSPFIANPPANASSGEDNGAHEAEFERIWNALDKANNARGWCEAGLEEVVNRLCGLELHVHTVPEGSPPFLGELKIIVRGAGSDSGNSAVLRLRANDSDGCLWRMRCGDPSLQVQIKRLLADG
ncbi:ARM repeat-containing protein [Schizophyllum commune Tattone D]|nr:ARM repeat-containing protein [Schizophyllum commune Tattone D]